MNLTTEPGPLLRAAGLVHHVPTPGRRARRTPRTPILRGIDLEVHAGELVAIVGASGSGKTTLLHCLAGLDRPDEGSVMLAGHDVRHLKPGPLARARRQVSAVIFQDLNLIPSLDVAQNVALPARLSRRRIGTAQIAEALARVGLADRAKDHPGSLSGGEQQRVAVARVLAAHPRLLFADEPTGALDSVNADRVLALLTAYPNADRAVVMVTHDLAAAARADRVLVIRDGALFASLVGATPERILDVMMHDAARVGDAR